MRRNRIVLALLGLVVLVALPSCLCNRIKGSGRAAVEKRSVSTFSEIEMAGAFKLIVNVDKTFTGDPVVEVRGDDNIVPLVTTRVSGDTLEVDSGGEWLSPKLPLTVSARVTFLEQIDLAGSVDALVRGLDGDSFEIQCAGSADVGLQGRVGELRIDVAGSADIDAVKLSASEVEVDIAGSAEASVCATDSLEVDIAGSGKVYYSCDPESVEQDISGSGKLIKK